MFTDTTHPVICKFKNISITMKSYLESQITWNLYQDSESRTLFYFVTDPQLIDVLIVSTGC